MNLDEEKRDRISTRILQIIGLGSFGILLFLKIAGQVFDLKLDIPWWVLFALLGFGASAELDFLRLKK